MASRSEKFTRSMPCTMGYATTKLIATCGDESLYLLGTRFRFGIKKTSIHNRHYEVASVDSVQ